MARRTLTVEQLRELLDEVPGHWITDVVDIVQAPPSPDPQAPRVVMT